MSNKPAITTSMIKAAGARPTKPAKPAITTGTVQPPLPVPRAVGLPRDVMITTADVEAMRAAPEVAPEVTPEAAPEVEAAPEPETPKLVYKRKVRVKKG